MNSLSLQVELRRPAAICRFQRVSCFFKSFYTPKHIFIILIYRHSITQTLFKGNNPECRITEVWPLDALAIARKNINLMADIRKFFFDVKSYFHFMQSGQVFLLRNTVSGLTVQNQETGSFGCSILHEVQIYNV